MTQDSVPITVPPELVQQWWDGTHGAFYEFEAVVTQAARWGADQELEACCDSLQELWAPSDLITSLRTARRPKPPSLKELALETVQRLSKNGFPCNYQDDADWDTIRRALEQLDD